MAGADGWRAQTDGARRRMAGADGWRAGARRTQLCLARARTELLQQRRDERLVATVTEEAVDESARLAHGVVELDGHRLVWLARALLDRRRHVRHLAALPPAAEGIGGLEHIVWLLDLRSARHRVVGTAPQRLHRPGWESGGGAAASSLVLPEPLRHRRRERCASRMPWQRGFGTRDARVHNARGAPPLRCARCLRPRCAATRSPPAMHCSGRLSAAARDPGASYRGRRSARTHPHRTHLRNRPTPPRPRCRIQPHRRAARVAPWTAPPAPVPAPPGARCRRRRCRQLHCRHHRRRRPAAARRRAACAAGAAARAAPRPHRRPPPAAPRHTPPPAPPPWRPTRLAWLAAAHSASASGRRGLARAAASRAAASSARATGQAEPRSYSASRRSQRRGGASGPPKGNLYF